MFSDGQIPAELSTSALKRRIATELKSEAGKEARLDGEPYPSWDVIGRVRQMPLFP